MTLASVRFGNVLGSRGSFLSVLADQIARAEPMTVTHPDVTRFFMTVEEAVGLVLEAAAMAEYAETFVLDMGEPVRIVDLVHNYAAQLNLPDVEIRFTGLRPGREAAREGVLRAENRVPSAHPKIWATRARAAASTSRPPRRLYAAADDGDGPRQGALAARAVPEYRPPRTAGRTRRSAAAALPIRTASDARGSRPPANVSSSTAISPWLRPTPRASAGRPESSPSPPAADATVRAAGSGGPRARSAGDGLAADRRAAPRGRRTSCPHRGRLLVGLRPRSGAERRARARGLHVTARYRPRAAHPGGQPRCSARGSGCWRRRPCCTTRRCGGHRLRGRVPLHASVDGRRRRRDRADRRARRGRQVHLLCGRADRRASWRPRTTSARATTRRAYGVVEPLRRSTAAAGAAGRDAPPHGERPPLPGRVPSLSPTGWSCSRRAAGPTASAGPLPPAERPATLVAGTYMAGELRRFWAFAGHAGAGDGLWPAHPDVHGVAARAG